MADTTAPTPKRKARQRPPSRPQRWADALAAAQDAINELIEIQGEYVDWRDNLPENLDGSALAEKLDEVIALDFDYLSDQLTDAESVELPLGFGRD